MGTLLVRLFSAPFWRLYAYSLDALTSNLDPYNDFWKQIDGLLPYINFPNHYYRLRYIGCSAGQLFQQPNFSRFYEVIASEPLPYLKERARRRIPKSQKENWSLFSEDANTAAIYNERETYHAVVCELPSCVNSLDNGNLGNYLNKLRALLKPNGKLIVLLPIRQPAFFALYWKKVRRHWTSIFSTTPLLLHWFSSLCLGLHSSKYTYRYVDLSAFNSQPIMLCDGNYWVFVEHTRAECSQEATLSSIAA